MALSFASLGELDDLHTLELYALKQQVNPPPPQWLNEIREVQFYGYDPATLAGLPTATNVSAEGETWYFFSKQGILDGFVVGHGIWKLPATTEIRNAFGVVGWKTTRVYHEGHTFGVQKTKTEWHMSEYKDLDHHPNQWLLYTLYRSPLGVSTAAPSSTVQGNAKDDRNKDDAAGNGSSSDRKQKGKEPMYPHGCGMGMCGGQRKGG